MKAIDRFHKLSKKVNGLKMMVNDRQCEVEWLTTQLTLAKRRLRTAKTHRNAAIRERYSYYLLLTDEEKEANDYL